MLGCLRGSVRAVADDCGLHWSPGLRQLLFPVVQATVSCSHSRACPHRTAAREATTTSFVDLLYPLSPRPPVHFPDMTCTRYTVSQRRRCCKARRRRTLCDACSTCSLIACTASPGCFSLHFLPCRTVSSYSHYHNRCLRLCFHIPDFKLQPPCGSSSLTRWTD